ncbi:sensor histidine kinase [Chryseobacterium gleum]|uniref:sensor histidine kinase n=1 Tax=Chryseobacterium gleum TaxID=250 RepID=UPI001E39C7AF|nr:HAMP domain-containing sensor histidine kinase [Chryseobacterium gleum]MCD9619261.1 HAMP domain-containing histidine kinase [Chryseobacterium gleum]
MIAKSKILIPVFAALFLLLLGIQVYFMYKTYQVKERDIYRSVNDGLTNYTDNIEDTQKIKERNDDSLHEIIIQYYNKEINKNNFLNQFIDNRKSDRERLIHYINSRYQKDGYEISARIRYLSIIHLPDSTKLITKPIIIFETQDKIKHPRIASNGSWETSTTKRDDTNKGHIEKRNTFLVKTQTDFEIRNIKSIVFKELTLLISCCILLLSGVLILYIFTIKNLIKQQKQVEVLHSIVDNISHEFKTPIATLKIASRALKKEWNPETLPLIDRQISRLESLMSQLHKDEISDEMVEIQPEDWSFFIQDLAVTYPDTDFRVKNSILQKLPFDKNLMETVIKNLCENSVKYGASVVTINLSSHSRHLEIEISDNGQGMETIELNTIFEKFYRIQNKNIHNSKGLGLGLYFVKKIIDRYSGKIVVFSQLHKGSTFKISIPYEN